MRSALVLVAEDNPSYRSLVETILTTSGFKVISAEDSNTALKMLPHSHPDIIVTDLMMPDISGIDFIKAVRTSSQVADIPIIAMTAYDKHFLNEATAAGATAVLHKEDMRPLPALIEQILSQRKPESIQETDLASGGS